MRRLNVKLALWLVGITLVLVVGVHFLHGYQLDRNAVILRVQAENAEKEGDTKEAIKQYVQYLKYRDDADGYSALAALVVAAAKEPEATVPAKRQAYNVLEEAIRRHPELLDVRKLLIDYTMLMRRWSEALEHIEYLAGTGQKTPDMDFKVAECNIRIGEEAIAIKKLYEIVGFDEQSEQFKPNPPGKTEVEAFDMLAQVLRRKPEYVQRADDVMAQLVALNPDLAKAHLALANYFIGTERVPEAKPEFDKALELGPDDVDVLIAVGSYLTTTRDFEASQKLLDKAVEKDPSRQDAYIRLAQLAHATGNAKLATEHLVQGAKRASETQSILPMLFELQFQANDFESTRVTLKQMQDRATFGPEFIRYCEARILFAQGNFLEASKELEAVRLPMARTYTNYVQQLDMLLSRCYEVLGMHDRQLEVSRRVLQAFPSQLGARLSEATALQSLGRFEESAMDLRLLVANVENFPFLATEILQLQVNYVMQLPPEQRDWTEVDKIAARLYEDPSRKKLDNDILKSDLFLLQDRPEDAQKVLAAARKEFPKELGMWMAWVKFFQRDNTPAGAEKIAKVLTLAEKELGDVLPLRVERIRLAAQQGGDNSLEALAKLEQGIENYDERQRTMVMLQLGAAYLQQKNYEGAKRCWSYVREKDPKNAQIRQVLFELAIDFKDVQGSSAALKDIRDSANWGPQSPLYKYCAATALVRPLIVQNLKTVPDADKKTVEEARRLIDEAIAIRGEWSHLWRVRAEIDQLDGNIDAAIISYQRAIELSHTGQAVVARRLVQLLCMQRRFAEANDALKYVGQVKTSDPLHKVTERIMFEGGDTAQALEMAEKDVLEEPSNPANHMWYGQLLDQVGRTDEAEEQYRKGAAAGPDLPQIWQLLVRHLMTNKKKAEAVEALRQATEPLADNPIALAKLYETVEDYEQAEHFYQEALAKLPDDPQAIRQVVEFYFKTAPRGKSDAYFAQLKKANPLLERIIQKYGKSTNELEQSAVSWARRTEAEIVAAPGDYDSVTKAVKLIEQNNRDGRLADEDILALVTLLGGRNEPDSRAKSIQLLEQLQKQRPLGPREQMVLGQLYERSGKWKLGKDLMVSALTRQGSDPSALMTFAQTLIRHEELEDAGRWLDTLDELLKKASMQVAEQYKTATIETRARLLIKLGQNEQAVQVMETLVPRPLPPSQLSRLNDVARLMEELGQYEAAEKLLVEYMTQEPRATIAMAAFQGRRGNVEKALSLLQESRKNQPLFEVLPCAMEALRGHPDQATAERFKMLEDWAKSAIDDEANSQQIKLLLAEMYDMQGKYPDLIKTYREVLADKNASALQKAIVKNNLAFALALTKENGAEALQLVNEAIQVMGPTSDLLDTRALAYLAQGNLKQALADLQLASSDSPSMSKYFHLAQAEKQNNNLEAARTALAQAQELGVDVNRLTPLERKAYEQIVDDLK